MDRRQFLRSALGTAALAGAAGPGCLSGRRSPPNIIVLVADDLRRDALGCAGNGIVRTPAIDRLAKEGVLFENAFVTTSICMSSRASIFTGQYVSRHGINDFSTDLTDDAFAHTYPALLRGAGYRTGFIGKYGVGDHPPGESFDYWKGFPGQGKYEHTDAEGKYRHLTSIMGDQAVEFLEGASSGEPFCLSVSFKAPHVQDGDPRQFIYDPVYRDLYRDTAIPEPKTGDPRYFESLPDFMKRDNEGRHRWDIRFSTPEKYQESVKSYYRLITGMDAVVGRIRKALAEQGLEENTVILFTSDNGFFLGEHGLAGKWYGYEESIRIPLIVFDPAVPDRLRGRRRNEMVLNIDIAPTVLSMAGVSVPERMQGKPLLPLVKGKRPEWREVFFYEHRFDHPRIPKSEGVRTRTYKYLRYTEQNPVHEELYDIRTDPLETVDLARLPGYGEILESMRGMYRDLGQECR